MNYDYDLAAWRESVEGTKGYAEGVEILDKNGGADTSLTRTLTLSLTRTPTLILTPTLTQPKPLT